MFKLRNKGKKQASRKQTTRPTVELKWRRSWNWGFLLLPILLGGYQLSQMEQVMPIRSIQLVGNFENLDQREVESDLQSYIGQGFFSLDIHQLQQTLKDKAWTESVSVRRIWPDSIRVVVREKKPIARWDDDQLLSASARV